MDVFSLREHLVQDYRHYVEILVVGLLERRVREATGSKQMRVVGTYATLGGPGARQEQRKAVTVVASTLFGTRVETDAVIGETSSQTRASLRSPSRRRARRCASVC